MNYGELIDSSYNPNKEGIYALFVKYFGDLEMTKIKDVKSNYRTYSMYAAKIYCGLTIQNRYVIIFVQGDKLPKGTTEQLKNLQWITLQTRSLTDNHTIPAQRYKPRRMTEFMTKINMTKKDEKQFVYMAEKYPLEIILLPKKKGLPYQPKGSIVSALETYNTIISFQE